MSRAAEFSRKILSGAPAGRRPMLVALDSGVRGYLEATVGDDGWLVLRTEAGRAILNTTEVAGLVSWLLEQFGEPYTRTMETICGTCLCPTPPGVEHMQHLKECPDHNADTCIGCAINRAGEA